MSRARLIALVCGSAIWLACGGKRNPGPGPTPTADPPQITCPAEVIVSNVATPSQSVTFADPTVTAGATPVTTTCSPASGTDFRLGTTAVNCQASDALSRTASCSFNVTLKGFKIAVTKYLTYGDSVTEGQNGRFASIATFVDVQNSYPTKLQALFDATFPDQGIVVVNRGTGGLRAEESRADMARVLAQERPGAVLILSGYNNLLLECKARDITFVTAACDAQIDTVLGALREMVRLSRGAGASFVFVGTMTPPGPFVSGSDRRLLPAAVTKLNAKIRVQVAPEGATIVDTYSPFLGHEPEYTGPDGLHLDPPGNQSLADTFFAAIKSVIPQTPTIAGGVH